MRGRRPVRSPGKLGIRALDQLRGALRGLEQRKTNPDLVQMIGVGCKRCFDGIEALTPLLDRRDRQDAKELVAAEANVT
jgi:hypothetical protein